MEAGYSFQSPDTISGGLAQETLMVLERVLLQDSYKSLYDIFCHEAPPKMILFATRLCKKVWSCRAGKCVTSMQIRIISELALCKICESKIISELALCKICKSKIIYELTLCKIYASKIAKVFSCYL